jgi:hypothetical protein
MLDAVGAGIGKRRLGVASSRSQLNRTAAQNFIDDCMVEKDVRYAIRLTRRHLKLGKETQHGC